MGKPKRKAHLEKIRAKAQENKKLRFMDAIVGSYEGQVGTILKEIRDGFSAIFTDDVPDEIVAFLDEGLTIDYNDEKNVLSLVAFLVQMDKLSERLVLEGLEPVTMVDGPEKVLAMLISVLRCLIGQLITVLEPSTSNGEGTTTLQSALEEVKREVASDDENAEAIDVNESDILGSLNALNGMGTRRDQYAAGSSGRKRPVTSNNAALYGPGIAHHRPLIQKGRSLSKYLNFSEADKQMEEVDLAVDKCPFCPLSMQKSLATGVRSGLITRHIKEVHKEHWNSYAKIKCAAKECDYRAINVHSMRCHCYVIHAQQYDSWVESGRLKLPTGSLCPFCAGKFPLLDLGQYKQHVDEAHLEDLHQYASAIGCTCKKSFGGTCELFMHWTKDQCGGSALLLLPLPLAPQLFVWPETPVNK